MQTIYNEFRKLRDDAAKKREQMPNAELNELLKKNATEIAKRYGARGAKMLAFVNSEFFDVRIFCKFPKFNSKGVEKYAERLREMGYVVKKNSPRKIRAETTDEYHIGYYTDYEGKSWSIAFNAYVDYNIEKNNIIYFLFGLRDEEKVDKALKIIYPVFGLSNISAKINL